MKFRKEAVSRLGMVLSASVFVIAGAAAAQSNRPITVVVPFAAGGGTDITTRAMQESMADTLDVSVAVKNTAGAGGTIGVGEVARARPNGTTLGMAPVGPLTTQPHLRKLPYDVDSFDYICLAYSAPTVIAVREDSPFSNLDDLVAYAKENPGELTFAVQAIGSIPHIAGLALEDAAGIKMTFLPVDGDGPALKALLDGTADLFIPHVSFYTSNAEQLKSLALLKKGRLEEQPDLVTAEEQGFPLDFPIWGGLVAPAGLDDADISRFETACKTAIDSAPFQERMEALKQPSAYMGAADFAAFVHEKYETNRKLLEKAGLLAN
ncbi:Bug family tripartite tricarboxylate transporter substrate binding protein [Martelella radicis]|uniref:Tripartite-type tricarboxylate transporter receptor subunit TctC n=1 Tax=Martelella radicis TaxID=1397476 RepID=A0A7W6KGZ7_9HYPH|nr:tripartite tricarboxylate transporter substrate binding protein [Martelella radicis]MBB4120902.1 tripartite-type tricarboxylate transporter receptor subunit TctC [Martelella radicis]